MKYVYTKQVELPFYGVRIKIKEVLSTEKLGVLTEIDVKATMN